jgi:hypothetical protein
LKQQRERYRPGSFLGNSRCRKIERRRADGR